MILWMAAKSCATKRMVENPQSHRESQDKTTYQLVTWTQDDESSEELPMQLSAALVKNRMPYWIMKHYIFKKMVYVLYGNPRTNHQQGF